MDFSDTPEEAAYRAKARAWLTANAPAGGLRQNGEDFDGLAMAKQWQALKADAGFAQITWPVEWGGPGGTPIQSVIYGQEEEAFGVANYYFNIGLGMCLPTVAQYADDETRTRFLRPGLRGDEVWCQLFSEPAGGSDVAASRTRATRDGDDWVVNGQKVWSSGAQISDYGIVLTRTDPDLPKHKGMTMFWVDMKSPGIEVRPIHQMSGASGFSEVFFTDVRIPDRQRLGAVNDGWKVSLFTLMNERLSIGGGSGPGYAPFLEVARNLIIEGASAIRDSAIREKLADWYVLSEGLKHTRMRAITALSKGATPGPENSIGKVVHASLSQDLANSALDLMDEAGIIDDPAIAPLKAVFQRQWLQAPGVRIAGGTDEILRNIIAERVLGLPGDLRVDKDVPFRDIPNGR